MKWKTCKGSNFSIQSSFLFFRKREVKKEQEHSIYFSKVRRNIEIHCLFEKVAAAIPFNSFFAAK